MCSACVLDSFSIAAMMAVMPPSTRMDSVEKLVCAPVPGAAAVTAFRGPGCYPRFALWFVTCTCTWHTLPPAVPCMVIKLTAR